MNNKKKKIIIISIILGILVLTIGLTYAMFTISKYSSNSKLIAGDIYMHYKEASQGIKLENAIPSDTYDTTSYFEFTIDGKNTYLKKDIYYEIVLAYGDEIQNKTRIKDNLLKFRLTEVIDNKETELFTDRSFSDLTNKRIWVETIPKGTNNEILKRYRLYMWLSNDTIICGGDETENCDYYIDKEPYWKNVYASIKVGVNGDFEEKTLATEASCFTTEYNYESATVNSVMASQTYQTLTDNRNELSKCVDYFNKFEPNEGETALDFCKGTGTFFGNTFQTHLDNNSFDNTMLTELKELNIVINDNKVNSIMASQEYTELPDNRNELSKCMDYYKTDTFDDGSTNETYCKGTGTLNNKTFQDGLNNKSITLSNYLIDNNIVKVTGQTITITNYDDTCEKDVVIPSSINGIKVTAIGGAAFGGKELTSVIIPNTVINIMDREYKSGAAFGHNNLKKVTIPNSVTTIGEYAFFSNQLTSIINSNSVTSIGKFAFESNQLTSVDIPDSITTIAEGTFRNNKLTNINLPKYLTSIGKYAFEGNQLKTFEIPNGLTELTDFLGNNPLKSITFQENSKITEIKQGFISDNNGSLVYEKYQNLESIEIPDSVTKIGASAFTGNQLTSITIGKGIQYIGEVAFNKSNLSNPNLSKIIINKSCSDIKNISVSSTNTTKYYPWLSYSSPYTATGVTIYGSNNEVCDSF